jgi:hypothetical protein
VDAPIALLFHLCAFGGASLSVNVRPDEYHMKYHAFCPGCGARFPRWHFLKVAPHIRYRCGACGCRYQSESVWEWVGDAVGGTILGGILLLGLLRIVSWPITVLLVGGLFALGYFLFPYVTRFVLTQPDGERHD